MKKPKSRRSFIEWMAHINSRFYTEIEYSTILKTLNMPAPKIKVETALDRAYKALDVVLNYEPQTFAEINSLKAIDLNDVKHTRDKLKAAFEYSLTLKPKH